MCFILCQVYEGWMNGSFQVEVQPILSRSSETRASEALQASCEMSCNNINAFSKNFFALEHEITHEFCDEIQSRKYFFQVASRWPELLEAYSVNDRQEDCSLSRRLETRFEICSSQKLGKLPLNKLRRQDAQSGRSSITCTCLNEGADLIRWASENTFLVR